MSPGQKRPAAKDERRARVAEIKAAQERADRRRSRLIAIVVTLVALALVVPATVLIVQAQQERSGLEAAAEGPIEG